MNVFKLKQGHTKVYDLTLQNFENTTMKKAPYYQKNEKGEEVFFAICPACDNPIQIKALYKKSKNSPRTYGMHTGKNIRDLPQYNHNAYQTCPYAFPNLLQNREARIANDNPKGREILELLKNNFDKVIYILEKELDIFFSRRLARSMLESFLAFGGHLYVGINYANLPYIFVYQTEAQSMFGLFLKKDTLLYEAINSQPEVCLEKNQIQNRDTFFQISFCILNHRIRETEDKQFQECIDFVVTLNNNEIFRKTIIVDQTYFYNLINSEKAFTKNEWLEIAKEITEM